MSLYTLGKGLFEAGKLGVKQFAKKQAKKIPKEKVQSARDKLDKAGQTIDRAAQAAKKTGADALRQSKILGKNVLRQPKISTFEKRTGLGTARDLGATGLSVADPVITAYEFSPLFNDEEDFTASNAAFGLAGLAGIVPAFRIGRRSLKRLGLDSKATRTKDGQKQSLDKSKLDRKIERPFERATLGFGGLGAGIVGANLIRGPEQIERPELDNRELSLDVESEENKALKAIQGAQGPKEKEALQEIERMRKAGREYNAEEINTMLDQARKTDQQNMQPDAVTPGEAAQPPGGDEPPSGKLPTENAAEDPNSSLSTDNTPANTEISVDKNPEVAVVDADKTATDMLKNSSNPTGNKTNPTIPPPVSIDFGGIQLRAEFMQKDFSGVEKAMKKYETYLQGKRDKMMNFEQYQNKYKDILGSDFGQEKNLAMFKWAMAMKTGRSNEAGLNGFLDIAGQAGLVYADDVAAINAQQRAERQALASSFMQYEQDLQKYLDAGDLAVLQNDIALQTDKANEAVNSKQQYFNNVMEIAKLQDAINTRIDQANKAMLYDKNRQFIMVKDENGYDGVSRMEIAIGKDGKRYQVTQSGEEGVGEVMTPLTKAGPTVQPLSAARVSKVMSQLTALDLGIKFTNVVENVDQNLIGSPGAIEGVLTNFSDLMDDWGNMTGLLNGGASYKGDLSKLGADNSVIDGKIQEMIINNAGYKGLDKTTTIDPGKVTKETNKLLAQYSEDQKEAREIATDIIEKGRQGKLSKYIPSEVRSQLKNLSITERDKKIQQLAALRLIQNRMKYIVANADKGEDRLTVADVRNAEATTNIFDFFKSSRTIKENYTALRGTLQARADVLASQFNKQAGDMSLLDNLNNLNYVRRHKQKLGIAPKTLQQQIEDQPSDSLFQVLNVNLGTEKTFPAQTGTE